MSNIIDIRNSGSWDTTLWTWPGLVDMMWAEGATIPNMAQHSFRGQLWEHTPGDPGSWHFVTLPLELSDDITLEAGPAEGFGSIRVEVRIGSTTWCTSLFPQASTGALLLPVKKAVRRAEDLHAGGTCEVVLEVARPVPRESSCG